LIYVLVVQDRERLKAFVRRQYNFVFRAVRGICLLDDDIAVFQEELCSVELGIWLSEKM
jgi:hypothetical protein